MKYNYFCKYTRFNQTYAVYLFHFAIAKWNSGVSPNLSDTQVRLIPPFPLAKQEVARSESLVRKFS